MLWTGVLRAGYLSDDIIAVAAIAVAGEIKNLEAQHGSIETSARRTEEEGKGCCMNRRGTWRDGHAYGLAERVDDHPECL